MSSTSNVLAKIQFKSSYFKPYRVSDINNYTTVAEPDFCNQQQVNSLYVANALPLEDQSLEKHQVSQPLKYVNTVVNDTFAFAVLCVFLILTVMQVWSIFS